MVCLQEELLQDLWLSLVQECVYGVVGGLGEGIIWDIILSIVGDSD
jgi:hypothetical protein